MKNIILTIAAAMLFSQSVLAQWSAQNSGTTNNLTSVNFINANSGWAVGATGKIIYTTNGGANWGTQTSGVTNQLNSVSFSGSLNGLIAGSGGKILMTSDGGLIWQTMNSGTTVDLFGVYSVSTTTAIAVGDNGKIIKTIDGGFTWTSKVSGTTDVLWSVFFTDANTGWAVGGNYAFGRSTILKTINGGESWTAQTSPTTLWLYSVSFSDSQNGWAVGPNGTIIATTNGGTNWGLQPSGEINEWFYGCGAASGSNIWVGGSGGLIKATANGGTNWTAQTSGITDALRSFSFVNATTGWAVGDAGKVLKYTPVSSGTITVTSPNGGENWKVGSSQNITWTSSSVTNVKIEYSVNNGTSWTQIIASTPAAAGVYAWTVSNSNTTQALVKVSDAADNTLKDQSNAVFTIYTPTITVISPNGGEEWKVGTNRNITWTSNNVSNIKLEYSVDSGSSWATIIASTAANTGSYIWTIPNSTTSTALVRVTDTSDNTVMDQSNSVFRIYNQTISVLFPNGGENWKAGSSQTISWIGPNVPNVKLEYSIDNGTNWIQIAASVPTNISGSPNYYSWTVPNVNSTQALVRISDTSDNTLADQSNAVFTTYIPTLGLTSPNGGEEWKVGTNRNITWTSNNVSNVKLEYSVDSGSSWATIIASTAANTGSYIWTIPNSTTSTALVRVTDTSDNTVKDQSNNVFRIYNQTVSVLFPNGGENWKAGSSQTITWIATNVPNVKIEYSINNGSSWVQIAASATSNIAGLPNYYSWTIPNINSTQALVRISDTADDTLADQSNAMFTTYIPTLGLTSPNGGENWKGGTTQNITWTSSNVTNVKLEYSVNNGTNWTQIIASTAASTGSYSWVVANSNTSQALVRISDTSDNTLTDQSNAVFTIYTPTITLTSPNGGENWRLGKVQNITWTSASVTNVKIEYTQNNGTSWTQIIENTPANSGSYSWTVPNFIINNCKVRISDVSDSNIKDESDSFFSVVRALVYLAYPNGGEKLLPNSVVDIRWSTDNVTNINIELSTDGESNWTPLASNIASSAQRFSWTVPNSLSTNCKIRISDVEDPTINDMSDNVFTIFMRTITLTSPNGGEKIAKNTRTTIKWISNYSTLLSIDYTIDGGLRWIRIGENLNASLGKYDWVVPDRISNNCLIRLTDQNQPLITDKSESPFSIQKGTVTLISPKGGEYLLAGNNYSISWTGINVSLVKVFYSIDNGGNWQLIDNASGSLVWNVPMVLTRLAKIKIEDAADELISAESDSVFSICHLNLLSPSGGESWPLNTNHKIKWESAYLSGPVKLEYSPDDANNWYTIANNINVADSSYLWNMNIQPGFNNKVRISSMLSTDVKAQSAANFTAYLLKLVSPQGGEKFREGDIVNVNWVSDTNIDHLKLDFSTDNGNNWNTISYLIRSSEKSYSWTVPNRFSKKCLIRISDNLNQNVSAISDSTFSIIRPEITIINPQADTFYTIGSAALIKWRSTDVQFVRLEYLFNNSWNWKIIDDSVDADLGEYNWHFPDTVASFRIRVSDINSSASYISNGTVNSIRGSLQLKNPNGGDYLKTGSTVKIEWNSVLVDRINILLGFFENGNYRWTSIANLVEAGLKEFNWMIPNTIQGNVKIKIEDAANPNHYDESDSSFSLSRIRILTPIENQICKSGTNLNITWDNSIGKVKIDYSTDSGISWINIVSNYTLSRNTYSFYFQNIQSRNCLVRISDSTDTVISKKFTIYNKNYEVVFPSRTRVRPDSEIVIQWYCYEDVPLKIESVGLFNSSSPTTALERNYTARVAPYSYSFYIPTNTTVPSFSIHVKKNCLFCDQATATISIIKLDLDPNLSGQILKSNSTFRINWASQNIDKVKLEYSTNGGSDWTTLADSIQSNLLKYDWTVPNTFSQDCLIRIIDKSDSEIYSLCRTPFAIVNAPFARFEKPIDRVGVRLEQNKIYSLKWKTSSIDTFNIEQSNDNGNSWSLLLPKVASTNDSISWQIANMPTNEAKLRIVDTGSNNKFESKSFSIISGPILRLTNLSDKIYLFAKQEHKITWVSKNLTTLKLEYRLKPSLPWEMINHSFRAADSGYCYWTPPDLATDSLEVKLTSLDFSYITHSIQNIKIVKRPLRIVSPNGFESYQANSRIEVSWINTNAGLIKIYISQDNGETWSLVANRVDGRKNKAVVWLPQLSSSRCLFKISSYDNSNVLDVSDTTFTIWQSSAYRWKKVSNNLRPNSETTVGNLTFLNNSTGLVNKYFSHVTVSITYTDVPNIGRVPSYSYSGTSEAQILQTRDGGFSWQPVLSFQDFTRFSLLTKIDDNSAIVIAKKDSTKTIYATNNEGDSWQAYPLPIDADIKKIVFNGTQDGWIFAEKNGLVSLYKSTDSGKHWTQISANIDIASADINDIKFLSSSVGWVVGKSGLIYKTQNGGINWVRINLSTNSNLSSIAFNGSLGLIVGSNGTRYKTIDSGNTWTQLSSGITVNFSDLQLISSLDVWAFGNNSSWHSTDGGSNWTNIQIPYVGNFYNLTNAGSGALYILGVARVGAEDKVYLYRYGDNFLKLVDPKDNDKIQQGISRSIQWDCGSLTGKVKIQLTNNNGLVYESGEINSSQKSFDFIPNQIGKQLEMKILDVVDPLTCDSALVTVQRFDPNLSWVEIDSSGIIDLATFDQSTAYMRNKNGVYITNNSGANWSPASNNRNIVGHFFLNKHTFFIFDAYREYISPNPFYEPGFFENRFLYRYGNQGQILSTLYSYRNEVSTLINPVNSSIYFINEQIGWLRMNAEYSTTLLSTRDGGATWQNSNISPDKFVFINTQTGFNYNNSAVYRTTNGGVDWADLGFSLSGINFKDIFFANVNTGWVVGSFYNSESSRKELLIISTTNGGGRWQQVQTEIPGEVESIHFINNVGYISVRINGSYSLYKSADGGQTWSLKLTNIKSSGMKVRCFSESLVYLYGDDIFAYSTNGGEFNGVRKIAEENPEMPAKFELFQNYPNPFNPTTTIKYELPTDSKVKINIYNILGEEVEQFVDEVQYAGHYSKVWNGKGLASGVYLLRIEAESVENRERFVKTMKLLMIK